MPNKKRVRRATFSNIAQLEPHGRKTDDDSVVDPSNSSVQSPVVSNARPAFSYYQIAGDSMKLLDHDDSGSLYNEYEEGSGGISSNQCAGDDDPVRVNNTRLGRLSEVTNAETSSLDSNDLMDHRPSLAGLSAGGAFRRLSRISTVPSNISSEREMASPSDSPTYHKLSKAISFAPSAKNHRQSTTTTAIDKTNVSNDVKHKSPRLTERWVRSRRSMSQLPLINDTSPGGSNDHDYHSFSQGDEDNFVIAIDEEAVEDEHDTDNDSPFMPAPHRPSRLGPGGGGGGGGGSGTAGFLDQSSDIDSLNSKPSSRRGSDASSLDDVCYPIDSPRPDSTTGGPKVWPDLSILTEFAEEELKELSTTQAAASNRPVAVEDFQSGGLNLGGLLDEDDRAISPFTSGVSERGRYAINEAESAGGRLRPRRIIPWANNLNNNNSNQKNYSNRLLFPSTDRHIPGLDEKAALDFRFTYFCEDMEATIHSPTISGLLQPGQSFASLFPPRVASHSPFDTARGNTPAYETTSEGEHQRSAEQILSSTPSKSPPLAYAQASVGSTSAIPPSVGTHRDSQASTAAAAAAASASASASAHNGHDTAPFWLDVLNPTEEEMKVLSKTFGIHPLTTEDIFLGETREKVELFRNYYLVCFRSIDTNYQKQRSRRAAATSVVDPEGNITSISSSRASRAGYTELFANESRNRRGSSVRSSSSKRRRRDRQNELKPLNMYIIVFHEGVLSFHFAPTAHPINVRRRARLLRDYLTVSSDWISYALIDDITDGFAPLIESIEDDVNMIEESILKMHSGEDDSDDDSDYEEDESSTASSRSTNINNREMWKKKGDMLRQIGECRKRVMSLLRLLGNKADVIKGFSKRCNEQWEVAPRNEIGLYLGDIQDHIITMVQSLNHYEKLLARSHSNYLAQINIDMTKANNDMNDVLGRITVLGTIVVPMNVITGLWGMNVIVPGQEVDSLAWFWTICSLLFVIAILCFWVARRIYKIA